MRRAAGRLRAAPLRAAPTAPWPAGSASPAPVLARREPCPCAPCCSTATRPTSRAAANAGGTACSRFASRTWWRAAWSRRRAPRSRPLPTPTHHVPRRPPGLAPSRRPPVPRPPCTAGPGHSPVPPSRAGACPSSSLCLSSSPRPSHRASPCLSPSCSPKLSLTLCYNPNRCCIPARLTPVLPSRPPLACRSPSCPAVLAVGAPRRQQGPRTARGSCGLPGHRVSRCRVLLGVPLPPAPLPCAAAPPALSAARRPPAVLGHAVPPHARPRCPAAARPLHCNAWCAATQSAACATCSARVPPPTQVPAGPATQLRAPHTKTHRAAAHHGGCRAAPCCPPGRALSCRPLALPQRPGPRSPASPRGRRRRCGTCRTSCSWWPQPTGRQHRPGTSTPRHLRNRGLQGPASGATCTRSCSPWRGCWRPANRPSACCWTSSRTWRRRRPSGMGASCTTRGRTSPTAGPAGTAPASSTAGTRGCPDEGGGSWRTRCLHVTGRVPPAEHAGTPAEEDRPQGTSVEHDFRQQEGRFQRVLSSMERDGSQGSPPGAPSPPEPSPVSRLPAKLECKKSRRKCFWFL